MNKKRVELLDILVHIYHKNIQDLKKLKDSELNEMLKQCQKNKIETNKNPNRFFIIDSLQPPKVYKTKTSKKAGIWVIVVLGLTLLGFLGLFMYLALA